MAWDKDLPLGSKDANLLDNDIRTNNAALEAAFDDEHVFASGGASVQTGRHKLMRDTSENIALGTFVAGAIALSIDEVSGYDVPMVYDGTDWWNPLEPFLDNANDWVKGQYHTPVTLTSGANIASDWTNANIFHLSIAHNGQLDNPDNMPSSGKSGVWFYIVVQSDASGWQLTYDTRFYGPNGGASGTGPTLTSGSGKVDVLMCTLRISGGIDICNLSAQEPASTTATGISRFATDTEAGNMAEDEAALTPSNLNAVEMGTGTGVDEDNVAWSWLHGKHPSYGRFVMQWCDVAIVSGAAVTITWAKEFASSSYSITLGMNVGSGVDDNAWWHTRSSTQLTVDADIDCTISVIAVGPVDAI